LLRQPILALEKRERSNQRTAVPRQPTVQNPAAAVYAPLNRFGYSIEGEFSRQPIICWIRSNLHPKFLPFG
jgi:hypothetical protein